MKRHWLETVEDIPSGVAMVCQLGSTKLRRLHNRYKMGVDRTLFLARTVDLDVIRVNIRRIVENCSRC